MSETPDIAPIPKPSAQPNFYKILTCPKCGWGAHHETPEGELSSLAYDEAIDKLNARCARCGARYAAAPLEPNAEDRAAVPDLWPPASVLMPDPAPPAPPEPPRSRRKAARPR